MPGDPLRRYRRNLNFIYLRIRVTEFVCRVSCHLTTVLGTPTFSVVTTCHLVVDRGTPKWESDIWMDRLTLIEV